MDQEQQLDVNPSDVGVQAEVRAVHVPADLPVPPVLDGIIETAIHSDALAAVAAQQGLAALAGEQGFMYDSIVYAGAIALQHLQRYVDLADAAAAVRATLDSGKALLTFKAVA